MILKKLLFQKEWKLDKFSSMFNYNDAFNNLIEKIDIIHLEEYDVMYILLKKIRVKLFNNIAHLFEIKEKNISNELKFYYLYYLIDVNESLMH